MRTFFTRGSIPEERSVAGVQHQGERGATMSVDRGKGWLACTCWMLASAAGAAGTAQPTLSKVTAVDVVRANVELEWASFRARDKRAYGELLAEEYRGVEVDSQGTRDKTQA